MQKKIFAWAMSMAVAAMITCTGCAQNTNSSGTDSGSSTAQTTTLDDNDTAEAAVGQSLSAIQSGEAGVTTDEDDLCDNYDAFDAEITLEDDSTKVKGNTKAVSVKDNCITISAGGTYRLSGKLTKGQVLVTGSEKVKLYLDGVEITFRTGSGLHQRKTHHSVTGERFTEHFDRQCGQRRYRDQRLQRFRLCPVCTG